MIGSNSPGSSAGSARRGRRARATRSETTLTRGLDWVLGGLLGSLLVAAPWLFGCTEAWSVNLMNSGCLAVGICGALLSLTDKAKEVDSRPAGSVWPGRLFLLTNVLVLAYCAVAIFNARATFSIETGEFTYLESVVSWLPTTYDRGRSIQFFVNSLSLFCFFWGFRMWCERDTGSRSKGGLSGRAELILWLVAVNGFLVALQGLLQRLSGSSRLLWFRRSYWDTPEGCFGPFSYRGNAADYLNLVWPLTFGLWYVLASRRGRKMLGIGDGPELLLLPMFVITAAASFATLSRGGAAVAAMMLILLFGLLFATLKSRFFKIGLAVTAGTLLLVALFLSGNPLWERFQKAASDNLSGRTEIYENAQQIARDFKWLGTGPNTFLSVYHLYRQDPRQTWAAFLHDDWLETRVTFGRIGMSFVLLQLAVLGFWTYRLRPYWVSSALTAALAVSVLGCLIHAKRDFPFQTYGVFFTFVAVCALLTTCIAHPGPSKDVQEH